jgi:hypothetical protein
VLLSHLLFLSGDYAPSLPKAQYFDDIHDQFPRIELSMPKLWQELAPDLPLNLGAMIEY